MLTHRNGDQGAVRLSIEVADDSKISAITGGHSDLGDVGASGPHPGDAAIEVIAHANEVMIREEE